MTNWLTLEEAARYLKMGKSTIYDLARKGKVPAHKMGRAWRFDAGELDDWLKSDKLALPDKWKNNKRQGRRPLK
jgi:excisionase family DNA binding protein